MATAASSSSGKEAAELFLPNMEAKGMGPILEEPLPPPEEEAEGEDEWSSMMIYSHPPSHV
jgi:hypothetical protein